jgi:multidrug efflux pump subunit AcrB
MSSFKTILLFALLAAIGFVFIPQLPVDLQPDTRAPQLTVSYTLPDAPPQVVEQEATAPLENAFAQINQIKSLYSVSNYGQGTIELTFDRDVDIAFKKFEVSSVIRQRYPKLHPQVSYPGIEQRGRQDKQKNPLLVYRVNANLAPFQIRKTVDDILVIPLAQRRGLHEVNVRGANEIQLSIAYDPERLKQYAISTASITETLSKEFATRYPGAVFQGIGQKIMAKIDNPILEIRQLEDVLIETNNGSLLPLKKLARIYLEEQTPRQYFRINGLNSITLSLYADEGVNRMVLAKEIKQLVEQLSTQLPQGFDVQLDLDDTEFLSREINKNIFRSSMSILILALFILISYRSKTHLLNLFSGILVSLGLTALVAYLLNISIHLYTIAGITISFGLLLDNAIVVLDHLYRKNDRKIGRAVLGATLTTVMALLLIFFLPEEERKNLREFSIIVATALTCSVLTALFFTPAVFSRFAITTRKLNKIPLAGLRRKIRALWLYTRFISLLVRFRKTTLTLLILAFGLPIFLLPSKWAGHNWYNNTIGSDFYQETLRPHIDKYTGGALRLFVRNVYERSGYRDPERTRLSVYAQLPYGNTLEEMNRVIQGVENYLTGIAGIEQFVAQVYSGQQASITITFQKKYEQGSLPFMVKSRLIAKSLDWGGVSWNIFGVGQGFSNSSYESLPGFRVEMKGYNYHTLEQQANQLAEKLLVHKRIQQVNTNERLAWDEKSAEHFVLKFNTTGPGINPMHVANALHQKAGKDQPDFYLSLNSKQVPVFVKPDRESTPSLYAVMEGYTKAGDSVYLKPSAFANLVKEKTVNAIHKKDRQYIRVVGFEYYGSYKFGNEYLDEKLAEMKLEMPIGYTASKLTWSWDWNKVKRQYSLLILLFGGIYIICAVLFENLKQPFYIVAMVPLSFIGLFLAFSWGDFYFDQGGYAAFIMLGGLTVNAAVFVVNDLNNARCRNYNRAVIKATMGKMRPIILTVLSTCLGLVPFLIGGQHEVFWFALAIGTIGGLTLSVLLVLVVLPVLLVSGIYNRKLNSNRG